MPPPSKRVQEAQSSSSASAPKRIRGSAANWRRAGFEADPVMNSHCFTWQNESLKEPDEDNEQCPWRMPTTVNRVVASSDDHEIRLDGRIEPSRNEASITRSQGVKFMLIVTEPPNVSTREVIKISREVTEETALSYGARAPSSWYHIRDG